MAARALAAALGALLLAGCGASGSGPTDQSATLLLDFQPNAVHAGIYLAKARGYTDAEGVRLRIRVPGASTDAVKALAGGRAQLAVLDIHDLALARERGSDLVGVMALVQRPLAAVVAAPGIRTPRDLEGHRVGVTGLPSDDAVLRSIVQGAGGDAGKLRPTTIGFDAVRALLGGRVSGATAFWNVEGLALQQRGTPAKPYRVFRVDDFGAPAYPELVLTVTHRTLVEDPSLVRAAVRALQRGYREAVIDPDSATQALLDAVPGLERKVVAAQLEAVEPLFQASAGSVGTLDGGQLAAWARWEQRFGVTKTVPDVTHMFSPAFAREGAAAAATSSG